MGIEPTSRCLQSNIAKPWNIYPRIIIVIGAHGQNRTVNLGLEDRDFAIKLHAQISLL
jgi:hypothetical protein